MNHIGHSGLRRQSISKRSHPLVPRGPPSLGAAYFEGPKFKRTWNTSNLRQIIYWHALHSPYLTPFKKKQISLGFRITITIVGSQYHVYPYHRLMIISWLLFLYHYYTVVSCLLIMYHCYMLPIPRIHHVRSCWTTPKLDFISGEPWFKTPAGSLPRLPSDQTEALPGNPSAVGVIFGGVRHWVYPKSPWISILVVMVIHDDWRITRVPPIFVGNPQFSVMPNGMSQSWQVKIRRKFISWSSIMIQPAPFESLHFVSGSLSAHLKVLQGASRCNPWGLSSTWIAMFLCLILKYMTLKRNYIWLGRFHMLVNPGDDSILRVGLFFSILLVRVSRIHCFCNYLMLVKQMDMFMAAVNHRFFMPGYDMALQTVRWYAGSLA